MLVLSRATPEELAATYRFVTGEPLPDAELDGVVSSPEWVLPGQKGISSADPCRCSLHREAACWVLVFKGGRALLKYEIGLKYVAYLLSHPDEPVPSATLFSMFSPGRRTKSPAIELSDTAKNELKPVTDGIPIDQLAPDREELKARRSYYARLREYKETMNDVTTPESERLEAGRLYEELLVFLKNQYRPACSPGRAVTKRVHKSIQRLCDHLRNPMPTVKVPNPTALAFAEYIEEHIVVPSHRYTRAKSGARVRIARGELAGRLIFECPPDDRWSVRP